MRFMKVSGLPLVAIMLSLSACGGDDGGAVQVAPMGASSETVAIAAPAPSVAPSSTVVSDDAAATVTSAATAATAVYPMLRGINIAGGEFGSNAPGRMNTDYIYPTKAEIDYYANLGFKIIRVPFKWERIQPTLNGALSVADQQAIRTVITNATARGMTVVLDMHNYGQRATGSNYQTMVNVGTTQVPGSALADAWIKLAYEYRYNGSVWLGLMNEPHTMNAATWWPIVKKLVVDIRAAGLWNKLLVPGTAWTGAHSWVSSGNAANYNGFTDPANNFALEVHQYLDADSSGTSATCVAGSGARVAEVINWSKSKGGVKLFMGEMGATSGTQCGIEYRDMLNRMEASGVFRGWTAWGGGSWWPSSYIFRTLPLAWPNTATPTPHMRYLLEYVNK